MKITIENMNVYIEKAPSRKSEELLKRIVANLEREYIVRYTDGNDGAALLNRADGTSDNHIESNK